MPPRPVIRVPGFGFRGSGVGAAGSLSRKSDRSSLCPTKYGLVMVSFKVGHPIQIKRPATSKYGLWRAHLHSDSARGPWSFVSLAPYWFGVWGLGLGGMV